jgi:hypothetical protein
MDDQSPFADVCVLADGSFSIPELKWRELVFIGALRADGEAYVRDPARPLPPFERAGLFPEGVRLRVVRDEARVVISTEGALA